MSKKLILSLLSVFAGALTLSAQNYSYNFDGTDNDAWENGDALNSGGGILAQATWVMGELDGNLHAFSDGNFQKAVFFTPNTETFSVGETVTLDTRLRLADLSAFTQEKSLLRIGLRSAYSNGTTDVGLELHSNPNFSFKISEAANAAARTALTPSDESFHDLSIAITKTGTANTFDVSASWDGGSAIDYSIVNSTLYSVDRVFAVMDSRSNNASGSGGIWVDSFSATTVPEPSTYASIFGLMALAFVASRRKRD
jgi:hypothetical protein